jgi:hypothetical protein
MNNLEKYISELPQPETEEEKKTLKNMGITYLVSDTTETKVHEACGSETQIRTYKIHYTDKETSTKMTIPIEFPHYNAKNPTIECAHALKEGLVAKGTPEKMMDLYIESFTKLSATPSCTDPKEYIKNIVEINKLTSTYSK